MAVNQKAVKVLNKVLEAGFTDEKGDCRYDYGRYSFYAGHHGWGYYPHQ